MKVTIVGAGNMGLAMTAYMAIHHKAEITLFTGKTIESLYLNTAEQEKLERADGFTVTSDPRTAISSADVIFVTYPAFLRKKFIEQNQQYIKADAYLGFVPGYGGAEYACMEMLDRGVNIFGLQRVPYVARAAQDERGMTAAILSGKKELFVGAIPASKTDNIANIVEQLLDIPVKKLREYLSITLAPSNPLLHITGLYNVFKNFKIKQQYSVPMKFYEEWNDNTSRILFKYDEELQEICRHLDPLDMSEVVPLPVYYESPTPEAMTKKLKSIESFKKVMVPLKKENGGYVPDLSSRMFVEDYPYGVCIIKDFALMLGVKTPTVDMLLDFYEELSGHKYFNNDGSYTDEIKGTGIPRINGLISKEELIAFYHRRGR